MFIADRNKMTYMTKLLDIVICTYNRQYYLAECLRSLLVCEVPENILVRILIVDNNSNDGTKEIIDKFEQTETVKVLYLFENKQGKSHALNKALDNLEGDFVAFTDDDITVDRRWVMNMISAFNRYPERSCFGGRVVGVYPKELPRWLRLDGKMKFVRTMLADVDGGESDRDYGTGSAPGGNMFFRRQALVQNGYFRSDLGPVRDHLGFSEDVEFGQRFVKRGERFQYIADAVVYHPIHPERLEKKYLCRWQYSCAKSEVIREIGYKNCRMVGKLPVYLIRKLIYHALSRIFMPIPTERFFHRLKLSYTLGEIAAHLQL